MDDELNGDDPSTDGPGSARDRGAARRRAPRRPRSGTTTPGLPVSSAGGSDGTIEDDPRRITVSDDRDHWDGLVEVATGVLDQHELIVLPTDTVYGIACDPFSRIAAVRLRVVKGRGPTPPLPVLVHGWRQARGLVSKLDDEPARTLVRTYWPGPLTLILREAAGLTWDLGRNEGTVALRAPDHPFTLALLARTGPLAVTGASLAGEPVPATVPEVMNQLDLRVGAYFDAGPIPGDRRSTVVDLTGDRPLLLREGAISAEQLVRTLGDDLDRPEDLVDEDAAVRPADGKPVGTAADGKPAVRPADGKPVGTAADGSSSGESGTGR